MQLNLKQGTWLNQPKEFTLSDTSLCLQTEPNTDFWQRSYYGFQNTNAPALLFNQQCNFSFTAKVTFNYQALFDQCGIIIFIDEENWFKASIEFENEEFSRLGSVVTNYGYSDWATSDIKLPSSIWYRLHRRGPDFLIEYSFDGNEFSQMRVFHLHMLGETTKEMGKAKPPLPSQQAINIGLYACSPSQSSFAAQFDSCDIGECTWQAHQ